MEGYGEQTSGPQWQMIQAPQVVIAGKRCHHAPNGSLTLRDPLNGRCRGYATCWRGLAGVAAWLEAAEFT